MPTKKRDTNFVISEEGQKIRSQLEQMMSNDLYNTSSSYSAKTEIYTDNLIPFVDKHMNYLATHASVNPALYLANLRLITKLRTPSSAR